MPKPASRPGLALAFVCAFGLAALAAHAELGADVPFQSVQLGEPGPHWVFYQDMHLTTFTTGRFVLFDAADVEWKAEISTGQFPTLVRSADGQQVYVGETTYSRGTRGERHDFVTIYDTQDYTVQGEIDLPTGRRALMAARHRSALLGDGRFLVLYAYTPAQSVEILDLEARRHVGSVEITGCALVFPTGPRGFSSLCGDGALLTVHLDENGAVRGRRRSEPFFDPDVDPVMDDAVAIGTTFYFPSYKGVVHPVDLSGIAPRFEEPWPLVEQDAEAPAWIWQMLTLGKAGPWLPGGLGATAAHEGRRELYVVMHPELWSGGKGDHDFPGPEVWVFDVDGHRLLRRLEMNGVASSIHVTAAPEPLLVAGAFDLDTEELKLEVYDAKSGEHLRDLPEFGQAPLEFVGAGPR